MSLDLELDGYKEKKSISKKLELNESPDYLSKNLFLLNQNRLVFQTCEISYLYRYNNNKNRVNIVHGKKIDNESINASLSGILIIIFYSAIFSIVFYAFLIYSIKEKLFIMAFLLFFFLILSSMFNYKLMPFYLKNIDIRNNFSEYIEKVLNTQVRVKTSKGSNIDYKYIYDITGKINIPKNYKFISVQKFQLFIDKDIKNNRDKCAFIDRKKDFYKKDIFVSFSEQDKDDKLQFDMIDYDNIDNFDDGRIVFALNNYNFKIIINISYVFLVFQLLWVFSIYLLINHYSQCIVIYPAKYLTKNPAKISKTEIIIHGKVFEQKTSINMLRNENDDEILEGKYNKAKKKIQKEKEEEQLMQKRKEEEKRRLEMNTEVLSKWANSNYLIEVYKEYDTVKLLLKVREYRNEILEKRFKLGVYNADIEEKEEDLGLTSVFTPRGYDIKIKVTNFEHNYNIKIGNGIFDGSFRYN